FLLYFFNFFFFNDTATTEIYTLSLHDALPIYDIGSRRRGMASTSNRCNWDRSEEHTSELQSHLNLVCRLLLEKKKKKKNYKLCIKKKKKKKTNKHNTKYL